MYEIEADVEKNRLYIDLEGKLDADTLTEGAEETVEKAQELSEGFDIVNDLCGFRPVSPEAAEAIQQAQAELKELGVDRVVRIVDERTSQVVVNAFERRSKDVGYSGETADDREEAERLLDEEAVAGYLG